MLHFATLNIWAKSALKRTPEWVKKTTDGVPFKRLAVEQAETLRFLEKLARRLQTVRRMTILVHPQIRGWEIKHEV